MKNRDKWDATFNNRDKWDATFKIWDKWDAFWGSDLNDSSYLVYDNLFQVAPKIYENRN